MLRQRQVNPSNIRNPDTDDDYPDYISKNDNDDDDKKTPAPNQSLQNESLPQATSLHDDDRLNPNDTATLIFSITTAVIIASAIALALYFTTPAIPVLGLILGGLCATIMLTGLVRAITNYSMKDHDDYSIDDLRSEPECRMPGATCTSFILLKLRTLFCEEHNHHSSVAPPARAKRDRFSRSSIDSDEEQIDSEIIKAIDNICDNAQNQNIGRNMSASSFNDDSALLAKKYN